MMSLLRDLPIHRKMIALILVASGFALLATTLAVVVFEVSSYRPRKIQEARSQAQLFSLNLHAPLLFDQPKDGFEELARLADNEEIELACVYRSDLEVFAFYQRSPETTPGVRLAQVANPLLLVEMASAARACPQITTSQDSHYSGQRLEVLHKIVLDGELEGFLFLRYEVPPVTSRLDRHSLMFGAVLFALLIVSLLLSMALDRTISLPLHALSEAAHSVTDDEDFSVRVAPRGRDEIGYLTLAFNRMLSTIEQRNSALKQANEEQRALEQQLLQAQKMESIGRLAGGVAHDFNNLLTVVVGCTDLALKRLEPDHKIFPLLDNISKATTQATGLTQRLLAFARRQVIEARLVDLNDLLLETERMLRTLLGDHIELVALAGQDLWLVRADPNQIMQVLINLTVNARDAMPGGGRLTIETQSCTLDAEQAQLEGLDRGDYARLSVTDTGSGIPDDVKSHIFEPFFTTKSQGKGTGLGLATCYGIVKQSGGIIAFDSEADRGTQFRVYLPRDRQGEAPSLSPNSSNVLPQGNETVLVVEDNALVRSTTVDLLRAQGYKVLEAASGVDALQRVDEFSQEIHLLVTDVVMPGMGGLEVSNRVRDLRPGIRVLFVSGYTEDEMIHRGSWEGDMVLLQKPFTSEILIRKVQQVLSSPAGTKA